MEITDEPLAYFITWTVYGTFLQGDDRWWQKKHKGSQLPQPQLQQWHRDRPKHDILLLDSDHRMVVFSAIERHCEHRGWKLWVGNLRTNHVHVVVTSVGYSGDKVRDQLKANCTGDLRKRYKIFVDRPLWTTKGDWKCINTTEDLNEAIPPFLPDKKMILNLTWLEEDLNDFLQKEKITKQDCQEITKILIRSGFELVMEKEQKFTTDLYLCYHVFSKYFPEKEQEMREILHLYLNPLEDEIYVKKIVNTLGKWVIEKV